MGLCASSADAEGAGANERVAKELQQMHQQDQEILKLLLLGQWEGSCRRGMALRAQTEGAEASERESSRRCVPFSWYQLPVLSSLFLSSLVCPSHPLSRHR